MIAIFGLIKRWILNITGKSPNSLSTRLFLKLIKVYFSPPGSPGYINTGKWQIEYCDARSFFYTYFEIYLREIYKLDFQNNKSIKILDVGSNIGLSILYLREFFPNSQIIGVEADPEIFKILKKNIEYNNIQGVKLINKAAWYTNATLSFSPDNSDGGSLSQINDQNIIKVEAFDLNSLIEIEKFDFIKIDIEGAENSIFPAIKNNILSTPQVFIEYHSEINKPQIMGDIISHFCANGYRFNLVSLTNIWSPFTYKIKHKRFDGQYNLWFKKVTS